MVPCGQMYRLLPWNRKASPFDVRVSFSVARFTLAMPGLGGRMLKMQLKRGRGVGLTCCLLLFCAIQRVEI